MNIAHTKDTTNQVYLDALQIRQDVFISEQSVPADIEIDQYETHCIHFVLYTNEKEAVATCRLLPLKEGVMKLQRMAVTKNARGKNYGCLLIQEAEKYSQEQGYTSITLGAQITAIGFYEKLGYQAYGEKFLDAGIEHFNMEKDLK